MALIVQFYCNYIIVLPNILAIAVSTILLYRRHPQLLKSVIIGLAIFSLAVVPWLLYAQPWNQAGSLGFKNFFDNLYFLIFQINFNIVPVLLLLIPAIIYFMRRGRLNAKSQDETNKSIEVFLWWLVPSYLLVLSFNLGVFFRYMLPLIPVFILLLSVIIVDFIRPRILRYLLVVVLSLSNIISVLAYPFQFTVSMPIIQLQFSVRMPIIQLLSEITSKYDNKLEDVVHYLQKNGRPEETIYVTDPEFPLIFYTDMHVIDARFHPNVTKLPDWILAKSASGIVDLIELKLPATIEKDYELIVLPVHDSPHGDSCPEPGFHIPFTSEKMIDFKIYKKISRQDPGLMLRVPK